METGEEGGRLVLLDRGDAPREEDGQDAASAGEAVGVLHLVAKPGVSMAIQFSFVANC